MKLQIKEAEVRLCPPPRFFIVAGNSAARKHKTRCFQIARLCSLVIVHTPMHIAKCDTVLRMDTLIETQADRTDLPLVVLPCVFESMIEPFKHWIPLLENVARLKMYTHFTLDDQEIIKRCEGAQAVVVIGFHVTPSLYEALKSHVKCFAFGGTGVASYIDLDQAKKDGIRVCNVVHYGDHAVAEFAIALIMELARHVGQLDQSLREGSWDGGDGYELYGKTLAIVGLGGIGKTVARIAQGFGMKVSAWNSHNAAEDFTSLNITPVDSIGDLMASADVVSIHMPLLEATRSIITQEHLDRLRPGTLFVNTARAEVIEPGALTKRLLRGDIPAALDVYEHEPLPQDDPLRSIPGLILTPHVAWRTDGAYINLTKQCFEAVAAFFQGKSCNVVV